MRLVLALIFLGLTAPQIAHAQTTQQQVRCSGMVECTQALVSLTNRLIADNAKLSKRVAVIEKRLSQGGHNGGNEMRKGAARVAGSGNGYYETTIVFNPPFRNPPSVFLSPRDVNPRDHQQLWVKSISTDRAVIANCRRHSNPEGCTRYADDFHFDWIAVRR